MLLVGATPPYNTHNHTQHAFTHNHTQDVIRMFGDCCIPSLMLLVGATLAHGPGATQQPSSSKPTSSQCRAIGSSQDPLSSATAGASGGSDGYGDSGSCGSRGSGVGAQRPEALPPLVILLITASRLVLLPLLGVGWVLGARALGLIGPGTPRLLVLVALISNAVP